MKSGIFAAALLVAAGAAASFPRQVRAEAPAVEGVLVLRNGNVLAGSVRRYGDDYRINAGGAVLQVPADQVDMFSPSLEEAYEQRRRERTGQSADSHLELARWCMQVNLLGAAARELLDARTLDPDHSGLTALETRLRLTLELEAARADAHAGAATASTVVAAAAEADDAASSLPVEISSETQIEFVRSIQPMLIHGCTSGGCHQPGSAQRLQLDRWALEGNGNAAIVRRNLAATLGELNVADPPSSALMQWARLAHGPRRGATSRPLAAHQAALLMEWLNDAAGIEPPAAMLAEDAGHDGEEGDESATSGDAPRLQTFTPRDEFDPEIFNRRYATSAGDADESEENAADGAAPTE